MFGVRKLQKDGWGGTRTEERAVPPSTQRCRTRWELQKMQAGPLSAAATKSRRVLQATMDGRVRILSLLEPPRADLHALGSIAADSNVGSPHYAIQGVALIRTPLIGVPRLLVHGKRATSWSTLSSRKSAENSTTPFVSVMVRCACAFPMA